MSFAQQLKNEICYNRNFRQRHKAAQAHGMLLYGKYFSAEKMGLHTEHKGVAKLYGNLISDLVGISATITTRETIKRSGGSLYAVSVDDREDRKKILRFFGYEGDSQPKQIKKGKDWAEEAGIFISGVYLACGNITDPKKSYMMEFLVPDEILAEQLILILQEIGMSPRLTQRRGHPVVYIKESENIEDLLTLMGAVKSSLTIMEVKIYKDVRNRVNRVTNCETANIEKTVNASVAQVADINFIISVIGVDNIPAELQETALLRIDHPDCSLRELGEMMTPVLSRSAVNHRLKKLSALANHLKGTE